jgi:chemotaxis protein MotB
MRRRRLPESTENHERWLVSYADFITLLFAFFVVMYSISTVSNGSYRVLSDSIVAAFSPPRSSLNPVQVGEPVRSSARMPESADAVSAAPVFIPFRPELLPDAKTAPASRGGGAALEAIASAAEQRIGELGGDLPLSVRRSEDWVEIQIQAQVLFPSGSRVLLSEAVPLLLNFADILRRIPNPINVEGHTDSLPINNAQFTSNWDLSAARAATVVRLFESNGIARARLSATGHADTRPVADNDSEDGRAANRRVVLVVLEETAEPPAADYTVEVAASGSATGDGGAH